MENHALLRGTTDFAVEPTKKELENQRHRADKMTTCPMCGGPMYSSSKLCWDCWQDVRVEAGFVRQFMRRLDTVDEMMASFRRRVRESE
ncbi:MAG: hypothetical protein JW741_06060 [Sedimentisphaerales bacterium]|nr:hypothetical protein [Sedimentisphaerales bacterium]